MVMGVIPSRRLWKGRDAVWDVITYAELTTRGYRDTGAHSYGLIGSPNVKTDNITYWTSESERGDELWVGERAE
jgi:hypothetical protein